MIFAKIGVRSRRELVGRVFDQAIITHRYPIEDATEAFRAAAARNVGAIKVIIEL